MAGLLVATVVVLAVRSLQSPAARVKYPFFS